MAPIRAGKPASILAGLGHAANNQAKADAPVVAGGGESKLSASTRPVRRAVDTAEALGALRLVRRTEIEVERLGSARWSHGRWAGP